jgi:hypothetical protein
MGTDPWGDERRYFHIAQTIMFRVPQVLMASICFTLPILWSKIVKANQKQSKYSNLIHYFLSISFTCAIILLDVFGMSRISSLLLATSALLLIIAGTKQSQFYVKHRFI